jgi:hypothetical protein
MNNITADLYRRDFWPIARRDAAVAGYVLLREWSSIRGLFYIPLHLPRLLRKRRAIQSRRRANSAELAKWFR